MRKFVIGDIHGGRKALEQCLQRSGFNPQEDLLISIGDIADGWPEVSYCVDVLSEIKNFILIIGNHDYWLMDWLQFGSTPFIWTSQGGATTLKDYSSRMEEDASILDRHRDFFKKGVYYWIEDDKLFVHGGIPKGKSVETSTSQELMWDRSLWERALSSKGALKIPGEFKEIYIGHTTTLIWRKTVPMRAVSLINMDTGGGYGGKLTIMNIESGEFFQSDSLEELYPNFRIG